MPLSTTALEPLLRLAMVEGVGPGRLGALLRRFGSAERVLAAPAAELAEVPRFGAELVGRVAAASAPAARERTRRALGTLGELGAVAITPDDLAYPDAFRALPDPPYLFFAMGELGLLEGPGIGIVGTRDPSDYGWRTAGALAEALARAGYVVVSGMAKGIDAAAHGAALSAGGGTVGVLGQGIDGIYPAENKRLFHAVRERGLLISEYPPGVPPLAGNFPRRNRLISALSEGVLVVEMGARSGAQHTVTYALEQGKEVFAVPGPIGAPQSAGTNQLLKEGARLVTGVDDVLEELRGVGRATAAPARRPPPPVDAEAAPPSAPVELAPEEGRVLAALGAEARHVDEIAAACELPPGAVLAALLGLELHGLAEPLPGKRFRRP